MKAFPRVLYQLAEASPNLLHCTVSQIQEKHCPARLLHITHSPYAQGILANLCTLAIILPHGDLKMLMPRMLMNNFPDGVAKIKPK